MPFDGAAGGLRRFMVDVRSVKTDKLIRTEGPYSEKHAHKVKDTIPFRDRGRYYGDIRRAREEEVNDG